MNLNEFLGIDNSDPDDRLAGHLVDQDFALYDGLERVRRERGITVDQVAERMGISVADARTFVGATDLDDLLPSTMRRYAMALGARVSHTVEADPDVSR